MDARLHLSQASTNSAEDHFVKFLEAKRSLENGSATLPPYDDFMPACLEHTKDMVQSLDRGYTDVQLRQVLEHECQRDKEFTTVDDGFDGHKACLKFADELTAARNKELKTGSDKGYTKFCEKFFVHKGGKKPKKEKKEKKEKKKKNEKKAEMKKPKKNKPQKEEDSDETYALAPASAPAASPMASPMASPAAAPAPGPVPGPVFAPSPAEAEAAPAPAEAKSKCDLVYDAEYKRQMDMGRSDERAKKEAKAARYKCMGINYKGPKSVKGETQWWAIAIVVGGVLAFIIAGGIVHYRNS